MSAQSKKLAKSILVWMGLILPSAGWSGEKLMTRLSESSRIKNELSATVEKQGEEIERIKAVQEKRSITVDRIPLMDQKLDAVVEQSKENGRDIKDISAKLSRLEGKFDKSQALANP
jgi:uncharacterized coiled-coil DUF342 family protein